ncbi:nucleolar protein 6 [Sabethes cyaneus]|uniref:nucleolar protein 6 n=1 Tax=Sabethes cyaneus TaxID=53552 RepID=UPI00237E311D|nr:nucleolar protein 6 [Sabethes cyaneus]
MVIRKMKKFTQKKPRQKPAKVANLTDSEYDSTIENVTGDELVRENKSARESIESDSGHESSGGRFVRAPAGKSDETRKAKRKASDSEANQQKIKAMKQLYKPPTVDEINRLKETENLYHSNLFRLQVEEMINEVKVKPKVKNFVESWLNDFRKVLRIVKDAVTERPLNDIHYEGVSFPLELSESLNFTDKQGFTFAQQRIVHQIGATSLGTSYGKSLTVDLLLEIPSKCLQSEDYLNLRYHCKRAHFLCHLAEGLVKQTKYPLVEKMKFVPLKGDALKPVLELTPKDEKFAKRVKFVIHAGSFEKFTMKRFLPEKNNVRPVLIGEETADPRSYPTPHYNASILQDMRLLKNQEALENTINVDQVRQAIVLLKVWIHQRRFDVGYYGFDGAIVTFFIAHLIQVRKIHRTMSSYQIIRLFWNQLANSNWDSAGITMEPGASTVPASYHNLFEVVFLDSSGVLNICANLSGELYRRVKQEASTAIQLLDNEQLNSFIPLFLCKYPVYTQYDHILSIDKPDLIRSVVETFGSEEDKLNYFGNVKGHFRKMIHKVLRRGLGARVIFLVPIEVKETEDHELSITIGIMLNPQEAFSVVDKGPEAIDKVASDDFRQFWRGKAELRRFKDGSITESCMWGASSDPIGEKRLICRKIVLFLLNAHFDISEKKITYAAHQFEVAIKSEESEQHETVEERSLACIRAFDELSKILKKLDGVPLTINGLVGTDPVFRYADPDPPRATAKALLVNGQLMFLAPQVMNATIQLEASSKWPEQLEAIRRLKAAFYLKIADSVRSYAGASAELVPQAYAEYLDILYQKYLFRFHIVHQREITLLREYLSANRVTKLYRDTDRSIQLEMQATILPRLTSILHGLHQQHFSFGSVAAMAKRWLYSQLIDPFLWPDECTELILAFLFERQAPLVQPQAGFLRFLEYLACTDWSKELILLNFNEEIPEEKIEELEKQFTERRDHFPPLAIVTSCDGDKYGLFARRAPSQEVLNRVVFLAKSVVSMVQDDISVIRNKVHIFFKPSFVGYDLIIHLDSTIVPAVGVPNVEYFTRGRRECLVEDQSKDPAAGFNPVQFYLNELRDGYRKFAVFFYDYCGGDQIAVLWKPEALEAKPFTTTNVNGCVLSNDGTVRLNTEALIKDFEILGKGLVRSIERMK